MNAARWESDHDITCRHLFVIDDFVFVDDADREACEVIFVDWVEAWHFRGFSTDELAMGHDAAIADA